MIEKIIIGIQARTNSSRLPNKVLATINGEKLIFLMVKRLKSVKNISDIIICTTNENSDKKLIGIAKKRKITVFGGSTNDLLDRFYQMGIKFNATIIVRINADCPLMDPNLIEKGLDKFMKSKKRPDLVTNALVDTFPDGMQFGIFNFETIKKMWKTVNEPFWREYFFRYMLEKEEKFEIVNLTNSKNLSHLRWTVDYKEDLEFVRAIVRKLKTHNFTMKQILSLLNNEPKINDINSMYSSKIGINEFTNLKNKL